MSDVEDEEVAGEHKEEGAEGGRSYLDLQVEEVIIPKSLEYEEASKSLHMLGKDESGMRYAYLMMSVLDRKLTDVSVILQFVHIFFLDLGGNKLTVDALNCLSNLPFLLYLKADRNIVDCCDLKCMSLLQVLNLSKNKISTMSGMQQPELECLDLNYNLIYQVILEQEAVPLLKMLEVRGNVIDTFKGIYPPSLDSLYMAENRIARLDEESLAPLVNLRILHLRDNLIHKLNGFSSNLKKLKYLNLRKNAVTKVRQLRKLAILPALETLIISQNPVNPDVMLGEGAEEQEELEGEEEPLDPFRVKVLVLLPKLKRLNKKPVTAEERVSAELQSSEKYVEIMSEVSSIDEAEVPLDPPITEGQSEFGEASEYKSKSQSQSQVA